MNTRASQVLSAACLLLGLVLAGCATTGTAGSPGQSVTDALAAGPAAASQPASKGAAQASARQHQVAAGPAAVAPPAPAAGGLSAIATVNGRALPYDAWINLMKRSHGLSAFQQILAMELARQGAEAKGITLTQMELAAAYRQEVADIAGPETQDPAEANRIVQAVLARRGVGMDEFRLAAYRNAYLRRVAEPLIEPGITEDALKVEFDRLYGTKVQVRHIQVSDSASLGKVLEALQAGQDFADLARRFSQNLDSAADGGLLPPFSRLDPNVPAELREAAFGLEEGQVSGAVRIDGWTQILKLEKRLPAGPMDYEKVAGEVRRSLKDQLVRQKMQELLRNMLQSASIQVYDGELGKQFEAVRQAKP